MSKGSLSERERDLLAGLSPLKNFESAKMTEEKKEVQVKTEKHFTDIYQQADDDLGAIFCDFFLHARCHEITKEKATPFKKSNARNE